MSDREGDSCALPAGLPAGLDADRDGDRDADRDTGRGQGARIYGKQGCPHTARARQALPLARFIDVLADPAALEEMLRLSEGLRRVPIIVRATPGGEEVELGFRRGS